jgi:hypothetical protein
MRRLAIVVWADFGNQLRQSGANFCTEPRAMIVKWGKVGHLVGDMGRGSIVLR